MIGIHSYKPLEQAILAGEKEVKVTTPKFLIACAVAEECQADPDATKRLIGMVMEGKRFHQHNPEMTQTLLSGKGRAYKMRVTLTAIADALHIIKILNELYAFVKVKKDDEGHLTGLVEIVT